MKMFLFGIEMSPECQMLNTHSPDSVTFAAWKNLYDVELGEMMLVR